MSTVLKLMELDDLSLNIIKHGLLISRLVVNQEAFGLPGKQKDQSLIEQGGWQRQVERVLTVFAGTGGSAHQRERVVTLCKFSEIKYALRDGLR